MVTSVVTTKGQLVIPAWIRKKLNIKKGTKFFVEIKENEIILTPLTPSYFSKIAGVLPTKGKLTKLLLKERREDKLKEG